MSLEDEFRDRPEEVQWAGRYIMAKTRGRWEYVSRNRNIKAAVILAIDDGQGCANFLHLIHRDLRGIR